MAKLFEDRGVVLDRTYQLNVGGNMDFKNMLERDRLESKKISKTQAVTSNMTHDLGARNVHIGPSDYVAVARRPQMGLRPPRGPRLRRRPPEPGVQARGLGLPEQRRHHHRRRPGRQDRPGPRHRRPHPVRLDVPDEVPAGADARRPGPRPASRPSSAATSSADPVWRPRQAALWPCHFPGDAGTALPMGTSSRGECQFGMLCGTARLRTRLATLR